MADLNLQIELTPPDAKPVTITSHAGANQYYTDLPPTYLPGGSVAGRVTITSPTGPWKAEALELVLFWRTSGIGTRDTGVGNTIALAQKGTEITQHFTRDFELPVPLHPYSYNGRLIKIDWYIGLRVKKGWLSKQELELPIEVRPDNYASDVNASQPEPEPQNV